MQPKNHISRLWIRTFFPRLIRFVQLTFDIRITQRQIPRNYNEAHNCEIYSMGFAFHRCQCAARRHAHHSWANDCNRNWSNLMGVFGRLQRGESIHTEKLENRNYIFQMPNLILPIWDIYSILLLFLCPRHQRYDANRGSQTVWSDFPGRWNSFKMQSINNNLSSLIFEARGDPLCRHCLCVCLSRPHGWWNFLCCHFD